MIIRTYVESADLGLCVGGSVVEHLDGMLTYANPHHCPVGNDNLLCHTSCESAHYVSTAYVNIDKLFYNELRMPKTFSPSQKTFGIRSCWSGVETFVSVLNMKLSLHCIILYVDSSNNFSVFLS